MTRSNRYAAPFVLSLLLLFAAAALSAGAGAQRRQPATPAGGNSTTPAASQTASAAASLPLPTSDAVAFVELRRLLNDAVPRALAGDAKRLGEVNADVENFKARTGINARDFDVMAVGSRFRKLPSGANKLDHTVAVARGAFDISAIVKAGRASSAGRHVETKHAGKTVHVFTLNEQMKVFGLMKMRVSELAVCALDERTLAVGEPEAVRAAVDAAAGRGALKAADLAVLTQARTPDALVTFGSRIPPEMTRDIDLGMPAITSGVASVRELFGVVAMTPSGFDVQTVLRTPGEREAKELGEVVRLLKQAAPFMLAQVAGERGRVARGAAEKLQVTTQGADVQLRLEVPQGDVTTLVNSF